MVLFQRVFWLLNCTLEWSQLLCCEACSFLLRDRLLAGSFLVHFPAPGEAIFKAVIISEPFLKWHKRKRAHTLTEKQLPRRNHWLQQEWNFLLAASFGLSDLPLSGCHKLQSSDSRGGQGRAGQRGSFWWTSSFFSAFFRGSLLGGFFNARFQFAADGSQTAACNYRDLQDAGLRETTSKACNGRY